MVQRSGNWRFLGQGCMRHSRCEDLPTKKEQMENAQAQKRPYRNASNASHIRIFPIQRARNSKLQMHRVGCSEQGASRPGLTFCLPCGPRAWPTALPTKGLPTGIFCKRAFFGFLVSDVPYSPHPRGSVSALACFSFSPTSSDFVLTERGIGSRKAG